MAEIEPKTREEKLWNGEDIKPLTREEMYIKHIFDKTQTIPDHPITRKEMLMEKAGEGGGGDITIKQLTATENGTYSEEDTAYSPVIVNVPDVPPVLETLTVTENGTYTPPSGTDGYNEVDVSVQPKLEALTAIENDTYTPSSGKDGFSQVVVNVPPTPLDDLSVTENGTYNPTSGHGFDEVTVNVPLPDNAYLLKSDKDDVVSFNDGSDNFFRTLKAYIEPVQSGSGEPSPNNKRPISGWTSANVVDSGKNLSPYSNIADNSRSTAFLLPKGNYTFSFRLVGTPKYTTSMIRLVSGEDEVATKQVYWTTVGSYESVQFTLTESTTVQIQSVNVTNDSGGHTSDNIQIELDSQATTYESYNGSTYTIQFTDGSNPLTVYGGYVDLVSGLLVVTKLKKTLTSGATKYGSNSVTYANTATDANDGAWCIANFDKSEGSSPKFKIQNGAIWWEGAFARLGISSIEEYNTWNASNPVEVCYELATPITYQLTPTQVKSLLGVNNVWCDTGETEVEYFAKEVSA